MTAWRYSWEHISALGKKILEKPTYPRRGNTLNKLQYISTISYYTVIRKNEADL